MSSALSVEKLVSEAKEMATKLGIKKFDIYGAIVGDCARSHQLFTSIDDIKTNVKELAEKTMQKIIDAW
ncbi:MAG: hypothetical protein WCP16_14975 [Pseudanabaena sp. ELA645]|jgi:hypothetical protein